LLDSLAFTGPLLMFPLLSGIMGLKTDVRSFYVAMVATLVTFFGLKLLSSMPGHLLTLCGILANGVVFFGMHIMQNKGIATTNSSDLITNS
jgi:SSS family solute:Na+ symporter